MVLPETDAIGRHRLSDAAIRANERSLRDRGSKPPPPEPPAGPHTPDPEPMSRYTVGYLTGYGSGIGYAISLIEPLVEDDPENAVPAIRAALQTLAEQIPSVSNRQAD